MAFDGNADASACLPRTSDAARLNEIANEPAVRHAMGAGSEPIDLTRALADPANVALADHRGGFLFVRLESGSYELHTLLSREARGATALALAAAAFRFMFTETDCVELKTRTPGNLRQADLMARRAGFRELWTMAQGWPGPDGERVSLRLFGLTLDDWMMRDAALVAEGEAFHALLRTAAARAGSNEPLHPHDDEVHERAAGMASLMAKAGNHHKAVWAYSRWASMAGYRPIRLVSEAPAIYDTGNALVQARAGSLEILKWLSPQ